jgi:hypothetical protein
MCLEAVALLATVTVQDALSPLVQGGSRPTGSGERDDCLDLDRHAERQLAGADR